jgi:2-succinyl-5-enolpyruvyl-6-hydroxy-3-cyclohexene-1-carboxylate synthase
VEHFEAVFGTPHGKDLRRIVSAFGIRAVEVASVSELLSAYASKAKKNESKIQVIIAKMPNREENADNLDSIRERFGKLATESMAR